METFMVRVELRDIEYSHPYYDKLHSAMQAAGFSRSLLDKGLWRLPHAEYHCRKNETAVQILDRVWEIASKVKPNPKVLVTMAAEITHRGLDKTKISARALAAAAAAVRARRGVLATALKPAPMSVAAILKRIKK